MDRADVAVVGAGIAGCLIAREMVTRTPALSVVLLDRDAVGNGASRRSAGLHFPRGATERVRRMTAYSQDFYTGLLGRRPDLPIHRLGMVVIAAESNEPVLREVYLASAELTRVDPASVEHVTMPEGSGAWRATGSHFAEVRRLTEAIAGDLAVSEGVCVTEVRPHDSGVRLGLGSGRELDADRVVLAPGPWLAAPAWRDLVAPLGMRVKKVVALHVGRRPAPDDPAIVFHDEDAFLLPLHHRGHWLFSYTCPQWDVDPDRLGAGLQATDLADAHRVLERYAPALVPHATSGRVFCDAYSVNREPVVTTLDPHGRVVFAGAANGSGYRLAPAIAAEVGDLLHAQRQRTDS